jgi:hypothetical protein
VALPDPFQGFDLKQVENEVRSAVFLSQGRDEVCAAGDDPATLPLFGQ